MSWRMRSSASLAHIEGEHKLHLMRVVRIMLEQLITEVLRKHNATSDLSEALMEVITTNRSAVHTHLQTSSDFPSHRQFVGRVDHREPKDRDFFGRGRIQKSRFQMPMRPYRGRGDTKTLV